MLRRAPSPPPPSVSSKHRKNRDNVEAGGGGGNTWELQVRRGWTQEFSSKGRKLSLFFSSHNLAAGIRRQERKRWNLEACARLPSQLQWSREKREDREEKKVL